MLVIVQQGGGAFTYSQIMKSCDDSEDYLVFVSVKPRLLHLEVDTKLSSSKNRNYCGSPKRIILPSEGSNESKKRISASDWID